MTPQERKDRLEEKLKNAGIAISTSLPPTEHPDEVSLRTTKEIGTRIVCLFCIVACAFETNNEVFKAYLAENELLDCLSPGEAAFLADEAPDEQSRINLSWRTEALVVLMWSVGLFDELPMPSAQTDTQEIINRIPPSDQSPWSFIRGLKLRDKSEILDESGLIYRLHWAVRNSQLAGENAPDGIDAGIIQEWHHAINWITKYDGAEWDIVAIDT